MKTLTAKPLTAEAFKAYGDLFDAPAQAGRDFFDSKLVNLRPIAAKPSLSIARITGTSARPVPITKMERHEFSTQAFLPLQPFRYLVGVAPMQTGSDAPDIAALSVFVAAPGQAINYHANVWHLPMQVLDGEGLFSIYMFNDGTKGDVEFRDLPEAMSVVV